MDRKFFRSDLDLYVFDPREGGFVAAAETSAGLEELALRTGSEALMLDFVVHSSTGSSDYQLDIELDELSQRVLPEAALFRMSKHSDLLAEYLGAQHEIFEREIIAFEDDGAAMASSRLQYASTRGLTRVARTSSGLSTYRADSVSAAQVHDLQGGSFAESDGLRTCLEAARLRCETGIRSCAPNYVRRLMSEPNDPAYPLQWHYPQIRLPQAWDITTGSQNVIVAVLDSGIVSHPDIDGRLVSGADMFSMDLDPTDDAQNYHGLHVAGTIGANSNDGAGAAGVDWNCRIMPVRVGGLINGNVGIPDSAAINGIYYAAGLTNDLQQLPAQRANVVNMSFGGGAPSSTFEDAVNAARAQGVVLVAASGNESTSAPSYPASYQAVISVGAVLFDESLADYSNFGPNQDIVAPGGTVNPQVDQNGDGYVDGVLSLILDENQAPGLIFWQGTSMASPHVAGVAALLFAQAPNATPDQIEAALFSTCKDLGAPGRDDFYGNGLMDAEAALLAIGQGGSGGGNPGDGFNATPSTLDFGFATTQLETTFQVQGTSAVEITGAEASFTPGSPEGWLSAEFLDSTSSLINTGGMRFAVDRAGLPDGQYGATVTIAASNAASVQVQVFMTVSSTGGAASVDVLLFSEDEEEAPIQTTATQNSDFSWNIADIPVGSYLVFAISDENQDGVLNAGDYLGAYPNLQSPERVEVEAGDEIEGIDFTLEPVNSASSSSSEGGQLPIGMQL